MRAILRLSSTFLADGQSAAKKFLLLYTIAAFSPTSEEPERRYFDLFDDDVVDKISAAWLAPFVSSQP